MSAEKLKKTCFVVMGFGKKTDFQTGRTLDLDKTYRNIIKPAAEEAGLECFRADEILHSGMIDVPMYEQLMKADVVIADLSTANPSAIYQLGVRHALRPYTTIVIAEDQFFNLPFDVNTVAVLRYRHLGEDIGFAEVMRCRDELTDAIMGLLARVDSIPVPDSPVYMLLSGLKPPTFEAAEGGGKRAAAGTEASPIADSISSRLQQADDAQKQGDFETAKALLKYVRSTMKNDDPSIVQRLALVTYKSKRPTEQAALEEAREILTSLNPTTSNDTETLGLWGAVHKRLWDLTGDKKHLDEAVRGYERGFYVANDYYNGINLAYLLNVRADNSPRLADAVADFVDAERVRREVISICEQTLESNNTSPGERYWVLATMAEAHLGVGDEAGAEQKFQEASSVATAAWMRDSTQEQMAKLKVLLERSPLKAL
ncbi:MAG TPA: TRAFs-binding domain-containing protein [Pyrinomonadaceae bacterium]|nr:TRAFs-binding domain-containing protein [Pyrinomonadaceae bacterium]